MTSDTSTLNTGGFTGDPFAALNPPTTSTGCCGSDQAAADSCCSIPAATAGACCEAPPDSADAAAGCC
jgi:hypothetical protein